MNEEKIQEFEQEVLTRLVRIETELNSINASKNITYENQREIIKIVKDTQDQEKRISAIEESHKWMIRAITGAAITGIAGIVFSMIQIL